MANPIPGVELFSGEDRIDIAVTESGASAIIRKINQAAAACQRLSPEAAMSLRGEALRLGIHLESLVKGAAKVALETAVMTSPVDTGNLRGSWEVFIGVGRFTARSTPETDKDGQRTIEEGTTKIDNTDREAGQGYYIVNAAPHAVACEMGHSQQAPFGMTKLAVLRAESYVRSANAANKSKKV
jgi:hypothetical protein